MVDTTTKLKALGKFIFDGELVQYIMTSLSENHESHTHHVNYALKICNFLQITQLRTEAVSQVEVMTSKEW
jgi:hypothetical protein